MARSDYAVEDRLAAVVINPDPRNAATRQMFEQLDEACQDVVANDDVRALATATGGKAFGNAAGISGSLPNVVFGSRAEQQWQPLPKPRRIDKPVITTIEGYCVGEGLAFAASWSPGVVTTVPLLVGLA